VTGHLALVGTTASGKSDLALALARECPRFELVSVDSMQVYRGMDIGTAKASPAEQKEVRHHLLDLADPSETFTVAQFQRAFREAIIDIERRERLALLVGGTGLYLRAAVDDLSLPGQWPELRARLLAEAEAIGPEVLHCRLARLDPLAATRMEPTNTRRIARALEVIEGSGRLFSSFGPGLGSYPPSRFSLIGVTLPTEVVAARIEDRYHRQMRAGFLDEVRQLADRPSGLSRTARQALGYRELLAHLAGERSLEEALDEAVRRTRQFARRQRAWFRRDPRIQWLQADADPRAVVPALLALVAAAQS
jgi:tRNA dimethylallyltransferase